MCFGHQQHNTTHPILLMPLEEQLSKASSSNDELDPNTDSNAQDDSDADMESDISIDNDMQIIIGEYTDDKNDLQSKSQPCHELLQGYSIVDPIPTDPTSYT